MKNSLVWAMAGALWIGSAVPAASPAASPVAAPSLEWLSGSWLSERSGTWTEERWAPLRAGVLLGTSLTGRGEQALSYEFMRIAPDKAGAVHFWGSPEGSAPVPFALVAATENELVFENPKHDFPTRIVYRRDGDTLTATISGPGGRGAQSWSYRRRPD